MQWRVVILFTRGMDKKYSQMNVILLLYSLGKQLALSFAEFFLVAHDLTLLVLVHLHIEGRVYNTVPAQHLACKREIIWES